MKVRKLLEGKANIYRPKTNCRWSAYGYENILQWVGDEKWDLIHFNFGLWDWYGWKQENKATPESYAKNLESIVEKFKSTGSKLVFAVTTPPCIRSEKRLSLWSQENRQRNLTSLPTRS